MNFNVLANAYLETRCGRGSPADDSYSAMLQRANRLFGNKPIDRIEPSDIQALFKGIDLRTANVQRRQLQSLFCMAEKDGWLDVEQRQSPRSIVDMPTSIRILEECTTASGQLVFAFARFCGLHESEITNLKWSDIDLHGRHFKANHRRSADRICPLFHPLPGILEYSRQLHPAWGYVVEDLKDCMQLGVPLRRLAAKLNIHIERPFAALRASCIADLAADFPYRAINEWLAISRRRSKYAAPDDWKRALKRTVDFTPRTLPWAM